MSTPACPRCGYDLSGAVAAWEGACPLAGICSECGLGLQWARVLNPSLTTPKWSFEHTIDRRIRRLLATWLVAMLPWVFWRQLRMEHEIRRRRLLIFALVVLLLTHLAFCIAQGWETWAIVTHLAQQGAAYGMAPIEEPWVSSALAGLWPYRTYTIGWGTGYDVDHGYDVDPYLSPWMALPLCLVVSAPLALLLLPHTFKMARVRRLHILRGAIYGLCAPVAAVTVLTMMVVTTVTTGLGNPGAAPAWPYLVGMGSVLAAMVWYLLWWWFFTRRYLQLPRGWLVAIIILIIAGLLATTVAVRIAVLEAQRFN